MNRTKRRAEALRMKVSEPALGSFLRGAREEGRREVVLPLWKRHSLLPHKVHAAPLTTAR
jgi:hypothetical protein